MIYYAVVSVISSSFGFLVASFLGSGKVDALYSEISSLRAQIRERDAEVDAGVDHHADAFVKKRVQSLSH